MTCCARLKGSTPQWRAFNCPIRYFLHKASGRGRQSQAAAWVSSILHGAHALPSAHPTRRSYMQYYHADVFCKDPMTGNGLTVFIAKAFPQSAVMQQIAREFRQFETIFLVRRGDALLMRASLPLRKNWISAGHPHSGRCRGCAARIFAGGLQHGSVQPEQQAGFCFLHSAG